MVGPTQVSAPTAQLINTLVAFPGAPLRDSHTAQAAPDEPGVDWSLAGMKHGGQADIARLIGLIAALGQPGDKIVILDRSDGHAFGRAIPGSPETLDNAVKGGSLRCEVDRTVVEVVFRSGEQARAQTTAAI